MYLNSVVQNNDNDDNNNDGAKLLLLFLRWMPMQKFSLSDLCFPHIT
jgi:hypothetical protein